MDIDDLRTGFTYVLLEQVNPEKNENRFYYLAWQPSCGAMDVEMVSDGYSPRFPTLRWMKLGR